MIRNFNNAIPYNERNVFEEYDFQDDVFNKIKKENNSYYILNLDTGLGKTYIMHKYMSYTITLQYNKTDDRNVSNKPILIVTRAANIIDPWIKELTIGKKNASSLLCYSYNGSKRNRVYDPKSNILDLDRCNVIVTSYDTIARSMSLDRFFLQTTFPLIIYDEIHTVINAKKCTKRLSVLSLIKGKQRIALTASPVSNSIKELYILQKFMAGLKLEEIYDDLEGESGNEDNQNIEKQKKRTRLEIRQKQEEQREQKKKHEEILSESIDDKYIITLSKFDSGIKFKHISYHRIILPISESMENELKLIKNNRHHEKMRLLAIPRRVFGIDISPEISPKEEALGVLLNRIPRNDKVIVFSLYLEVLDYFCNVYNKKYDSYMISGSLSKKDREAEVKAFENHKGTAVLYASLKASGTGLNLQKANHVIFLEEWFNPQIIKQAKDRVYRIGQKKEVYIYSLSTNTYEEKRVLEIMNGKRNIFSSLFYDDNIEILEHDVSDSSNYLEDVKKIFSEILKNSNIYEENTGATSLI